MDYRTGSAASSIPGEWVPFRAAVKVWARVAMLSFGGSAGQIAVMHRILVDEEKWIDETHFLHALNYCMLLPGPEAHQLAVYVGWLKHGIRGGFVAGLLFMLPGVVAIMGLSALYVLAGNVGLVEAAFFGLKAAVLAIVIEALVRIGRRALRGWPLVAVAAAAFVAIFAFGAPFPLIILGAALVGLIGARAGVAAFQTEEGGGVDATPVPARGAGRSAAILAAGLLFWLGPVAVLVAALGPDHVFARIGVFFSQMAVVTFGGAYAALAYMAQQAVETHGWLTAGEMLDGLGMGETTPGPLILVVQFVAFMGAWRAGGANDPVVFAAVGGLIATWVTFAPSFLWVLLGAPHVERLRGNRTLTGALTAVTAAVVGVILNLALWFGLRTIFADVRRLSGYGLALDVPVLSSLSVPALALALGAMAAIFVLRLGVIATLALSMAAGILLHVW